MLNQNQKIKVEFTEIEAFHVRQALKNRKRQFISGQDKAKTNIENALKKMYTDSEDGHKNTERPTKAYAVFNIATLRKMLRTAEKRSEEFYDGEVKDKYCLTVDFRISEPKFDNLGRVQIGFEEY